MLISFSEDKSKVLFLTRDGKELNKLDKFPGLLKDGNLKYSPAILPVVFSLYSRCASVFKEMSVTREVLEWLESPFKLRELPESFEFFTTPTDFQRIALRYTYTLGSAGILLDPGMGKTKIVLDYIALMKFKVSIVVCPVALLFVWEDEVQKHRPDLGIYVVRSTDWEGETKKFEEARREALARGKLGMMMVINYDKVVIFKHQLKRFGFDYIHVDEFLIKNVSTSRTIAVTEISRAIPYRTGGSGTLINNSPLDAYSPIRFLQPALVGYNYGTFMERYCVMKDFKDQNGVARGKRPVAFKNLAEIRSILESCSVVMTKEKWLKLPEKHIHDIYIPMTEDQKEAYYSLMKNFYCQVQGRDIKADNPLTILAKLYQIAQGFVYYTENPEGESSPEEGQDLFDIMGIDATVKSKGRKKRQPRETLFFSSSNKADRLERLLSGELKGKKVLIWFNLSAELELIESKLKKLGAKYLTVKGGDKEIGNKIRQFNKDPSILYLACQAKSVNYGVTVMGSKAEDLEKEGVEVLPGIDTAVYNEVFFSMNFSSEVYSQQQDRIHRLGQTNECHYYRLFSSCPVESKIRQAISDKLAIREEMLIDVANTVLVQEETSG